MVANTDKDRLTSLCLQAVGLFDGRDSDQQKSILDALQYFKEDKPFKVYSLKPRVLGTRLEVTLLGRTNLFDSKKFFQTRNGLYVWNDFTNRILPVTKKVKSLPAVKAIYAPLVRVATDAEIQAELPEGHIFKDASAFCAYLADMIEKQANGEEGILLNNGRTNLFYVIGENSKVFAVCVGWGSGYRGWVVDACQLAGFRWVAGLRAFSATADS